MQASSLNAVNMILSYNAVAFNPGRQAYSKGFSILRCTFLRSSTLTWRCRSIATQAQSVTSKQNLPLSSFKRIRKRSFLLCPLQSHRKLCTRRRYGSMRCRYMNAYEFALQTIANMSWSPDFQKAKWSEFQLLTGRHSHCLIELPWAPFAFYDPQWI